MWAAKVMGLEVFTKENCQNKRSESQAS
jgi:hypothetical protein